MPICFEFPAVSQQRGVQLAVLIIRSTEGEPLAEFSHRAAMQWGGGSKEHNNGLLLTLAIADRQLRLEVGYGLEAQLPDITVHRILESVHPEMKQQQYTSAVFKIVDQIDAQLSGRPSATPGAPGSVGTAPARADQYAQKAGFSEGEASGLAQGLREAIWSVAELLGIEKTLEREAVLLTQSEAELKSFLNKLKQSRTWQSDSVPFAKSKTRA